MGNTAGKSRKRILKGLLLAIALMVTGGASAIFRPPDHHRLNFLQRFLVAGVVDKWETRIKALPEDVRPLVDYGLLWQELNAVERSLVTRILAINPQELGFKGPFHATGKPEDLIRVAPATYQSGKERKSTGVQYCPKNPYEDYLKMMAEMRRDLSKILLIENAYRSPGRQAYDFLFYLANNHDYSLRENARWNAMPGYSEHNNAVNIAIDFINEDGIDGDREGQTASDFEALPEYRWLLDHASRFNFYLTYLRNSSLGVAFEPWHWHWEPPKAAGAPEAARTENHAPPGAGR